MVRVVKKNWFGFVAIALGLSMSEVAFAETQCTGFPRHSATPIVEACETDSEYLVRMGDDLYNFDKFVFQDRIKQAASAWLSSRDQSVLFIPLSDVEIWLSVPESNPLAAQGRAMLKTTRGNLVFSFDLRSSNWIFHDSSTAILNDRVYPNSFGHRPAKLLAKSASGASPGDVVTSLMDAGATSVTGEGNQYFVAVASPFEELHVAKRALKSHPESLESVQVNSVFEWIAERQKIFQFQFDPTD